MSSEQRRLRLFLGLCLACAALTVGYTWWAIRHPPAKPQTSVVPAAPAAQITPSVAPAEPPHDPAPADAPRPGRTPSPAAEAAPSHEVPTPSSLKAVFLVRHTGIDQSYGRMAEVIPTGSSDDRRMTALACDRVHFAGHRGVCLDGRRSGPTANSAILFDQNLEPTATIPLGGVPSRAKISPDGRYAAVTVFTTGHSYASSNFSTATRIVDASNGETVIPNLEQLEVWSNGARIDSPDFNFWGVTFASDSNYFYATLSTAGTEYLVKGDIAARRATVIKAGIECPSLSPDNTRVAFKKRIPGEGLPRWRLYVLNLATLTETATAETRFLDDQVEWIDDQRILYALNQEAQAATDVWMVAADGSGRAVMVVPFASSPVILRRGAQSTSSLPDAGDLLP